VKRGYTVRVVDRLSFGGTSLLGVVGEDRFELIRGDLREAGIIESALKDVDAVVHLAAVVGDPACAKQPSEAEEINWHASQRLFEVAINSIAVSHFIFASTCSNYGKMGDLDFVTETSTLAPVSLYAHLKVRFEDYIMKSPKKPGCAVTALRFATAYGYSQRMRFDLTVNEFVREIVMGRELTVFGEQFWRPYCHVQDIAGAVLKTLECDSSLIDHEVFNVGSTKENYTKAMLVDIMRTLVPEPKIKFIHKTEDPRDYKVDFSKIRNRIGFEPTLIVPDGVRQIQRVLISGVLEDPFDKRYSNS
jgi:nucleoside-diphosphate-sugar epimerase